jgi:hypothetical protein
MLFPTKERLVMLTYWGTPEGGKANAEALDNIIKSIKPAK